MARTVGTRKQYEEDVKNLVFLVDRAVVVLARDSKNHSLIWQIGKAIDRLLEFHGQPARNVADRPHVVPSLHDQTKEFLKRHGAI